MSKKKSNNKKQPKKKTPNKVIEKEVVKEEPKTEIIKGKKYKVQKRNITKEKVYVIACIILIIDQFIKILIKSKMNLLQEINIIPNFFSLVYVENDGAAFSILQNMTFLLVLIAVACLFFIDKYLTKETDMSKMQRISLGLVMGGMLGNLVDRLLYQKVTDYLSFTFGSYNFAIFNFADIGICVGIFLLILAIIKEELDNKKK